MTPEQAIGALDRQVMRHGQTVYFARNNIEGEMQAFVRPGGDKSVAGLVEQSLDLVIVSPSELGAYGMPREKDRFSTADRKGVVDDVRPVRMQDVLVRIEVSIKAS